MSCIKLLLIDFDRTLTKFHTTGALCFSNTNFDTYLNPNPLFQNTLNLSENHSCDPLFLINKLLELIDQGICIGIITMADSQHAQLREKQLSNDELKQAYHVLAGRDLVIKWFTNIILKACRLNINEATQCIERLFGSKRFCIVAKFREHTKREHLVEVVKTFESFSTLVSLKPNQILYVEDSPELLKDMEIFLPGMKTLLVADGLTEDHWRNIVQQL